MIVHELLGITKSVVMMNSCNISFMDLDLPLRLSKTILLFQVTAGFNFFSLLLKHVRNTLISVMGCVCLPALSSCLVKLTFEIKHKQFHQIFLLPAILIGFYHFIPLPVTLALAEVMMSAQNKTCWLCILHSFELIRTKLDVVLKLDIFILLYWVKANTCHFVLTVKTLEVGMLSDVYKLFWFKFSMVIGTIKLCILTTV